MAKKYLEWLESKPFNFSTVFALPLRELKKLKSVKNLDDKKMGRGLR